MLIGILVVLPSGDDWPVPTALTVACSAATVLGLTVMVIGATGLGRGLTATPLPNAHAQLRTGGLYRYARHPIYSGLLLMMASITVAAGSGLRLLTLAALVLLLNVKHDGRKDAWPSDSRDTPTTPPALHGSCPCGCGGYRESTCGKCLTVERCGTTDHVVSSRRRDCEDRQGSLMVLGCG